MKFFNEEKRNILFQKKIAYNSFFKINISNPYKLNIMKSFIITLDAGLIMNEYSLYYALQYAPAIPEPLSP